MEITIQRTAEQNLRLIKLILKIFLPKPLLAVLSFLTAGFVLLFCKVEVLGEQLPFWHFGSALGLSLIVMALFRLVGLMKYYRAAIQDLPGDSTLLLSEESILLSNADVHIKYEWSYFKFYSLKGSLVILKKDHSLKKTVVIDLNELTESEQKTLNALLFAAKIRKV